MRNKILMLASTLVVAVACGKTTTPPPAPDAGPRAVEPPPKEDAAPPDTTAVAPDTTTAVPPDTTPTTPDAATPDTATADAATLKPASDDIATGANQFAFELLGRLGTAPGNLAFSPVSIELALALAYAGAGGETARQMAKVMHFGAEQKAATTAWGALARDLTRPDSGLELHIANRLFGEQSLPFEADYLALTKAAFDAPLEQIDFINASAAALEHINTWVAEATKQHITDLLPSGSVTPDTRLVLVDAIYFHAFWQQRFEQASTFNVPFFTAPGVAKDVLTMRQNANFRTGGDADTNVIEMPYEGGSAAMLIVVPTAVDGLAKLEGSLTTARLDGWRRTLASDYVRLSLPTFEIAPKTMPLSDALQALGMTLPFDNAQADFTKIARVPGAPLALSEVVHSAFVRVDESGTEAAAATALDFVAGGIPPEPRDFKVDHPFFFAVIDTKTGLVLFAGHVRDPVTPAGRDANREGSPTEAHIIEADGFSATGAGIAPAMVQHYIRRYLSGVKWCYQDALQRKAGAGRLVLHLTIEPNGSTTDTKISDDTVKLEGLEDCILNKLRRWRFPQPTDGAKVIVKMPLTLGVGATGATERELPNNGGPSVHP